MAIELDHVIVPSCNPVAAAKAVAEILDVPWDEQVGHFTPVYVNDSLTLDFDNGESFESHHYCFRVDDQAFDQIFGRIKDADIAYRSTPMGEDDRELNLRNGGRNFYWTDEDGHIWEVLTVSYARKGA
ncbi:MAG: VOC family protein [Rhodospirillaceae bacterium]|nr:VOC family protein [Rhodospirillaceae bacterium]MBT6138407.1 VOC family protein [Rhodospirillaceae bacterium]